MGEDDACLGAGVMSEKSLYVPLNFAVSLKLLLKIVYYNYNKNNKA